MYVPRVVILHVLLVVYFKMNNGSSYRPGFVLLNLFVCLISNKTDYFMTIEFNDHLEDYVSHTLIPSWHHFMIFEVVSDLT